MSDTLKEAILAALSRVSDPAKGTDIVSAGMVQGLVIKGGAVGFALEVDPQRGAALEPLRKSAEDMAKSVDGVSSVSVVLTAHSSEPGSAPPPPKANSPFDKGPPPDLGRAKPNDKPIPTSKDTGPIEGIDRIIAVGSGKGGVGKSTVASNIAVALAAQGQRVGLLDADVYGPSQPRMLGVSGRPSTPDGQTILPLRNYGVTVMSMGFMLEEDQSVVWRGPMLMSALQQMLRQVQWGKLDTLIVDLPPGTGDVQLTLSQKTHVDGAVIVSTPQDIALLDAKKALDMFQKLDVPILGMIENMSTYVCPNCDHEAHIFGHGGARAEAERLGLPFLGEIPLDIDIRTSSDGGAPIVVSKPKSPQAQRFREIAAQLVKTPVAAE